MLKKSYREFHDGLVPFSAPLEMGWIFMVSWKKRWSGYHVNRNY